MYGTLPSMRSAQLFCSLYTVSIALAAPVLPHPLPVKSLNELPIGYQPPATITIEGSRTFLLRPEHNRIALEEEEGTVQVAIDTPPLSSPSTSRLPSSAALSPAHPSPTKHLQSLSRLQSDETRSQQEVIARPEPTKRQEMPVGLLVTPGSNPAEGSRHAQVVVAQMDGARAARPREPGTTLSAGQHAEVVVVVGMVLAFILVILVMEMWRPMSRALVRSNNQAVWSSLLTSSASVCRALGREGAIGLREDNGADSRRAFSFRDPDMEVAETTDRKGWQQGGGEEDEKEDEDEAEDCGAEPWVL